ncbi:MAG: hypothetical protein HY520_00900 [Candidatus Aenigmarchaeota archaeon]|nr:hypothetical protein [Candidatus Aenigmarchaeota archaeon]
MASNTEQPFLSCDNSPDCAYAVNENQNLAFGVQTWNVVNGQLCGTCTRAIWGGGLPPGSGFPPTTGTGVVGNAFTWTPTYCQAGQERPVFYGGPALYSPDIFQQGEIAVANVNRPPSIQADPPGPITVTAGETVTVDVTATDPDVIECGDDACTLTKTGPGTFAASQCAGDFIWTTTENDIGKHTVTFTVTDINGGADITKVGIEVKQPPPPPPYEGEDPRQGNLPNCECDCNCAEGQTHTVRSDPVIILNGNLFLPFTDLLLPNPRGPSIGIQRSYNSRSQENGMFGLGWNFNYDADPIENASTGDISIRQDGGRIDTFTSIGGGAFQSPAGVFETLIKLPDGSFQKTALDDTTRFFDAQGRLIRIENRYGGFVNLTYLPSSILLEDSANRQATLTLERGLITRVEAPGSRVITYGYETASQGSLLANMTDALGNTEHYSYDANRNLASRADKRGGRYTYAYDSQDRITSQADPEGFSKQYAYNDIERSTTITDARGYGETRFMDESGRNVMKILNALGEEWAFAWNADNLLVNKTDVYGFTTGYVRDEKGNIAEETDPLGMKIEREFGPFNLLARQQRVVSGQVTSATAYGYDARGNLVNVTDPEGGVTAFAYNTLGQPISATDPNGYTTTYAYDPATGRLERMTNPEGTTAVFSYDEAGNLVNLTVTGAGGEHITTLYQYNKDNQILWAIDPLGRVTSLSYDENGNLRRVRDVFGETTTWDYFGNDLLKSVTGPLGRQTNYSYHDGEGMIKSRIRENGQNDQVALFDYDPLGRIAAVTEPEGAVTTYSYGTAQNTVTLTNPRGFPAAYRYDPLGRIMQVTDAAGNLTTYQYDDMDREVTITDRRGNSATITLDRIGRDIRVEDPTGNSTRSTYDPAGRLISITDERGFTTAFAYDGNNRLLRVTDPTGNTTSFGYDVLGRQVYTADALGHAWKTRYDPVGRVLERITPLNHSTAYQYDDLNREATITDAEGNALLLRFDSLGRVSSEARFLGGQEVAIAYGYDPAGNVVNVTDPNAHTTLLSWDRLNRLTSVTDPLGNALTYQYDRNGNLMERTDRNGNRTAYGYDGLDRLTSVAYPSGIGISYSYDAEGNLLAVQDGQAAAEYEYDPLGRLLREEWTGDGRSVRYSYDASGNRLSLADHTGAVSTYAYDPLDRLAAITDPSGGTTGFSYNGAGLRTGLAHPNGAATSYQYDEGNRLVRLATRTGGSIFSDSSYGYDRVGNRVNETQKKQVVEGSRALPLPRTSGLKRYTYDSLYRLIAAEQPGFGGWAENYTYDLAGNRLSLLRNGVQTISTYDEGNRLLSSTSPAGTTAYSYDSNGNLLSATSPAGTTAYAYDPENRLAGIAFSGGSTNQYSYGLGKRIAKQDSNGLKEYFYDGNSILMEFNSSGLASRFTSSLRIDEILSQTDPTAAYFHGDALGSVVSLTDPAGKEVASSAYGPFGEILSARGAATDYAFTGRDIDRDSGLYYYRSRHYDPSTGRFLQADPLGAWADRANLGNAYTYAGNNPVNFRDSFGLQSGRDSDPSKEIENFMRDMGEVTLSLSGKALKKTLDEQHPAIVNCKGQSECALKSDLPTLTSVSSDFLKNFQNEGLKVWKDSPFKRAAMSLIADFSFQKAFDFVREYPASPLLLPAAGYYLYAKGFDKKVGGIDVKVGPRAGEIGASAQKSLSLGQGTSVSLKLQGAANTPLHEGPGLSSLGGSAQFTTTMYQGKNANVQAFANIDKNLLGNNPPLINYGLQGKTRIFSMGDVQLLGEGGYTALDGYRWQLDLTVPLGKNKLAAFCAKDNEQTVGGIGLEFGFK